MLYRLHLRTKSYILQQKQTKTKQMIQKYISLNQIRKYHGSEKNIYVLPSCLANVMNEKGGCSHHNRICNKNLYKTGISHSGDDA